MSKDRVRVLVGVALTLAIVLPLGWMWWNSRLPASYSVMDMGTPDWGDGSRPSSAMGHDHEHHGSSSVSVDDLDTDAARKADVVIDLTARAGHGHARVWGEGVGLHAQRDFARAHDHRHRRSAGRGAAAQRIRSGWGLVALARRRRAERGGRRGRRDPERGEAREAAHLPVGRAARGHLLVPLPPALARAGRRWTVRRAGDPARAPRSPAWPMPWCWRTSTRASRPSTAAPKDLAVRARPGQRVRVRLVNTDNGPQTAWADVPYRVRAVDGYDVNRPTAVTDRSIGIPAGGKVDLELTAPADGTAARVELLGEVGMVDRADRCRTSPGRCAAEGQARPALLRVADRGALRRAHARSTLHLLDRAPAGVRRRAGRACGGA